MWPSRKEGLSVLVEGSRPWIDHMLGYGESREGLWWSDGRSNGLLISLYGQKEGTANRARYEQGGPIIRAHMRARCRHNQPLIGEGGAVGAHLPTRAREGGPGVELDVDAGSLA